MKLRIQILLFSLGVAVAAASLPAQGFGSHHGSPYFDPTTVITLTGELEGYPEDVPAWGHGNHTGSGGHLELVADDGELYHLHLAPTWFLEANGIVLADGDPVEVTGSVVEPQSGGGFANPPGGHGGGHGGGSPGTGGHGGGHGGGPGQGSGDEPVLVVTVLTANGVTLEIRDDEGYPLWMEDPRPWFDPDTVTAMDGFLTEQLGFWSPWGHGNGTGGGMHYLFESDGGEVYVAMLGPWWYLEDQGLVPEDGLALTITGSVVDSYWDGYADYRFLIATEIVSDGTVVTLRNDHGVPLWAGTGDHYACPAYHPDSVQWKSGTVRRTQTRTYGLNLDPGYEIVMRAEGRRYVLHVAPAWHVADIGFGVDRGQEIRVLGSLDANGHTVARVIKAGGRRWVFRDTLGNPRWVHGAP